MQRDHRRAHQALARRTRNLLCCNHLVDLGTFIHSAEMNTIIVAPPPVPSRDGQTTRSADTSDDNGAEVNYANFEFFGGEYSNCLDVSWLGE